MGKQVNVTGYHVEVVPDLHWVRLLSGPEKAVKRAKELCESIVSQIKRHVDDVGSVSIAEETEAVCEYCGSDWTEDGDDYNGGCCAEDEDAHQAAVGPEASHA